MLLSHPRSPDASTCVGIVDTVAETITDMDKFQFTGTFKWYTAERKGPTLTRGELTQHTGATPQVSKLDY